MVIQYLYNDSAIIALMLQLSPIRMRSNCRELLLKELVLSHEYTCNIFKYSTLTHIISTSAIAQHFNGTAGQFLFQSLHYEGLSMLAYKMMQTVSSPNRLFRRKIRLVPLTVKSHQKEYFEEYGGRTFQPACRQIFSTTTFHRYEKYHFIFIQKN